MIYAERSDENWEAGDECHSNRLYAAAASRFYYGLFLAIYGFFVTKKGFNPDLSDVHSRLLEKLKQEEPNGRRDARVLHEFKDMRVDADYAKAAVYEIESRIRAEADAIRQKYLDKGGLRK